MARAALLEEGREEREEEGRDAEVGTVWSIRPA
jgi:hypothetical protein